MDRVVTYYGALARALDHLQSNQNAMVAIAKLAEATIGLGTSVDGFTVVPTAPASLAVSLTPGQVYQVANLESSTISLLQPDTHTILKQGIMLDAVSLTLTPPTTPGYAQNVLIEVQYADSDSAPVVLNYYNAANPSVPLLGPGGNGIAQATVRKGIVSVQTKYGTASTSGTQVTPTPDAGWAAIYVVTLAYGQTSITVGNIAAYTPSSFIAGKLSTIPAFVSAGQVPQIISSPVLYVRSDGNDANDGSANTASKAFATIAAAAAKGTSKFFLTGTALTIQLGMTGTYAFPGNLPGGLGQLIIQGDIANQANYVLSGAGPSGSSGACLSVNSTVSLRGLNLVNTGTTNHTLGANSGASVTLQNVSFSSPNGNPNAHMIAAGGGAITVGAGNIIGWGMGAMLLALAGQITVTGTITLANTPVFSSATVVAQSGGAVQFASGSGFGGTGASGPRYLATLNGVINTFGAGASFIPGSTAGSTSTGGQYA